MKKHIFLLIAFFVTTSIFAQSNYTEGFNNGYKKGYCHDQGVGCIEPIPPIAPIPKVGESLDNYTDGYNRGFQMGLNARKSNSENINSTRTRYKAPKAEFVDDVIYQPPVELLIKAAEAKQRRAEMLYLQQKAKELEVIEIRKTLNPDDFAIINIYRPKNFMGSCCPVDVIVNGRVIEKLKNGGHLELKVFDLSSAEIIIESAGISSLRLIPQKDKIYYFETGPKFSGFTLEQINTPVSEKKLKKKNYSSKADYIF